MNLRDVIAQQWRRMTSSVQPIGLLVAVAVLWLAIEVLDPVTL